MPGRRKRPAAWTVCSEPPCPELVPPGESFCSLHKPDPWPDARERRPREQGQSGWSEQKLHREILREFKGICHVCGNPGSDEVDHVLPVTEGGTSDRSNLRPIHSSPCHDVKTKLESKKGKRG